MTIGFWQVGIVLLIVILLFGTKKLRNVGGDLGSALKGFKNAMKDDEEKKDADFKAVEEKQEQGVQSDVKKESAPQASEKASNKD